MKPLSLLAHSLANTSYYGETMTFLSLHLQPNGVTEQLAEPWGKQEQVLILPNVWGNSDLGYPIPQPSGS